MTRWIFRHYAFGAIAVEVAVCAVLIPYLLWRDMSFPVYLLVVLAALLAGLVPWVLLWRHCAQKLVAAAARALDEDCDPGPLLDYARDVVRQMDPKGKRKTSGAQMGCINEATALQCMGEYGQALDILDGLLPWLPKKPGPLTFLYWNNRTALCFHLGRAEEMAECLARAQAEAEGFEVPPLYRESFPYALRTNRAALRLLREGPTGELEQVYRELLETASCQRLRVGCHLTLGKCAQARGDLDEAREHYRYAAEHGGKLAHQREAEGRLGQIGEVWH